MCAFPINSETTTAGLSEPVSLVLEEAIGSVLSVKKVHAILIQYTPQSEFPPHRTLSLSLSKKKEKRENATQGALTIWISPSRFDYSCSST